MLGSAAECARGRVMMGHVGAQDGDGHDKTRSKRPVAPEAAVTPAAAPTPVVPLRAPDVTPMITASRATTPGLTLATSAGANDQLLAKVDRQVVGCVCKTQSVVRADADGLP